LTREEILELNPDAIFWNDLDDAIIGTAERCSFGPVVAYSVDRIILVLVQQGMTRDEAWEWFDYNINGAYVGEFTPVHIFI